MPSGGVKANPQIRPLGPLTEQDRENVQDCFAQGLGVAETARRLGLSTNQVTNAKRKWGLTSEPPPNAAQLNQASQSFATKARAHRLSRYDAFAETFNLLNEQNLKVLRGEESAKTILRGAMGIETMEDVDEFPARDLRDRMVTLAQLDLSMGKIEDKEDDGGLTQGKSTLEKVLETAQAVLNMTTPRPGLIQE